MGYIAITSRCNMRCDHCCVSARPGFGSDMSWETFKKAVDVLTGHDETLTIGGGEPTMHPMFWAFLGYALGHYDSEMLLVVTNGSDKETSIALARMARKGVLAVALSQDQYHDESLVDYEVIEAFSKGINRSRYVSGYDTHDMREIRNVEEYGRPVAAVGRGRHIEGAEERCACDTLDVDVTGKIWVCGHRRYQVGDVDRGIIALPDGYYDWPGEKCSEDAFRKGLIKKRTHRIPADPEEKEQQSA